MQQGDYAYLQEMVDLSTAMLVGKDGKPTPDGLVFLGNPQLSFPRLLYEDPVLGPVDRNVWAAIKLSAAGGDSITAFPSYEELMLRCGIGSKATISRSLSILRSTRWLTMCKARLRDSHGRVRGNIYALHDEPLQLVETLGLDDGYIDWLEASANGKHTRHPRAVAIASAVLRDMRSQLQAGKDITAFEHPMPRRAMAASTAARIVAGEAPVAGFFALGAASIMDIVGKGYQKSRIRQVAQKPLRTGTVLSGIPRENAEKTAETGKNRGVSTVSVLTGGVSTETVLRSSSKYLKKEENTTTYPVVTTEVGASTVSVLTGGVSTETVLAWPASLSRADTGLVRQQLWTVPSQHHQPVLDALAAKLSSVANGKSQPFTSNILVYTRKLCKLAVAGKLNPVATLAPPPPTDPNAMPQSADALAREIKALECQLSNLSSEVRHLKQIGKVGNYVPEALAATEERWKTTSQRYAQLKQMQGRVLH